MENPIQYKTEGEWVQACHESGQVKAAIDKQLHQIVEAHKCMTRTDQGKPRGTSIPCRHIDAQLVADCLEFLITESLHKQAEAKYIIERRVMNEKNETL